MISYLCGRLGSSSPPSRSRAQLRRRPAPLLEERQAQQVLPGTLATAVKDLGLCGENHGKMMVLWNIYGMFIGFYGILWDFMGFY